MAVLGYVGAVQVVVVFDGALVLVVDLDDELKELVLVHDSLQVVLLEQGQGHEWHLHFAADNFCELKQVEVEGVHGLVEALVLGEHVLDHGNRELEVDGIILHLALLHLHQFVPYLLLSLVSVSGVHIQLK